MENKTAPPPYNQYEQGPPMPKPYGFNPNEPQHSQPNPYQQLPHQPVVTQPPQPTIITVSAPSVIGGCPVCRHGAFQTEFTCCGIFCCILFFPIGLICLFTMTKKSCTNCGYSP